MKVKIMMGASGSGKSTYVQKSLEEEGRRVLRLNEICHPEWENFFAGDALILSADDITFDDDGTFHVERLGGAHGTCIATFGDILRLEEKERPDVVVVDNTNTSPWEIAPYVAMTLAAEDVELAVIALIRPEWWNCAARNSHGVSDFHVRQQTRRLEQTLDNWPAYWPQPTFA